MRPLQATRCAALLLSAAACAFADTARDDRWRQDLDYLAAQLPARHPNLFFQISRDDFDRAVANLRSAIPDLTDVQVMTGLAGIVALPGDAHTNLSLNQAGSTFLYLPIRARWFEDGLFVTIAAAPYARALGTRIVRIGDQSADKAYQTVSTIISHENDPLVRLASPSYLVNADILQALGIAPDNASVPVVFEDLHGQQFTLNLPSAHVGTSGPSVSAPDPNDGFTPLHQQHLDQNYWFTYLPGSRTLYFAYNSCMEMAGLPFATFNSQLFAAFDANPVDRLIIDLRNNGGGSDVLVQPAIDSMNARADRFKMVQRFVIVGRNTFSAAIDDSVKFKEMGLPFIGEATGGSVNHYGNVRSFTLPNSKLSVNHSIQYFSFPGFPPGSLIPDVNIPLYSADYFARHDPFLAAALAGTPSEPAVAVEHPLAIVNAASLRPNVPVAAGSLATLFGDFPGADLSSTELTVDGRIARLLAVTSGQINFRVPDRLSAGTVPVSVHSNGAPLSGTMRIASAGPGIFLADPFDVSRPGVVTSTVIAPGSIIRIYATGQAVDNRAAVFFANEPAEVLASTPDSTIPGLWEITARVPAAAWVAAQVPLFVVSGFHASNGVTVRVSPPN